MDQKISFPARTRVIFKNCELGTTDGLPVFRMMPEEISAGDGGICHIASAREITLVLGLAKLEEGFALLLDKNGRPAHVPQELFARPGKLLLIPEVDAGGLYWEFDGACLADAPGYGTMPGAGHRLLLEFALRPSGPGGSCMLQKYWPFGGIPVQEWILC